MFCEQNSTTGLYLIKSITVSCDNGCREDKCIESAGSNNNSSQSGAALQSICIDNDAALTPNDIYTKGLATVSNGLGSYTTGYDRCIDNSTVEEVLCIKNPKNENEYFLHRIPSTCLNGCSDGACRPRSTE